MLLSLHEFATILSASLSNKPKVAIVADNDIDGVTSAAKIDQAFYTFADIEIEPFFRNETDWELPIPAIQNYNPDLLIMLDIAVGSASHMRAITKKPRKSFSIDHHITSESELPPHLKMYNPCYEGQVYLPTVFLVDQVISRLFETPPHEFFPELTFLGVFADAGIGFEDGDFIIEQGLEDMLTWAKNKDSSLLEISNIKGIDIPKAHHLTISFNYYIKEKGILEANIQLVNSMDKKKGLSEFLQKIETSYQYETDDLYETVNSIISLDSSERNPVLVYHNETGEHGNGDIARLLVERIQKPTLVYSSFTTKKGQQILASGRAPRKRNTQIDLIPIFTKFGGGGHRKACGIRLAKSDFNIFLEEFLSIDS